MSQLLNLINRLSKASHHISSIESSKPHIVNQPLYLVIIMIFGYSAFAQANVDTLKIRADFDNILANLESNYVYYDQKNVDLICLKSYYGNQIGNIKTDAQTLLFFEYLLNEFYDSHLHLQSNNNSSYRLYSPIYAELQGERIMISSYWKDQIETNLSMEIIGTEILSFNGIDFNQAIIDFPTHCQNKDNLEIRTWIANKRLAGRYNEPRILVLKNKLGDYNTLDLDSIKFKAATSLISYKTIDNIGVIRINNSLGTSQTKTEFKNALKNLVKTKGLILDLRNTIDGGNTSVANPIAGHFTSSKVQFQKYKNNKQQFADFITPTKPNYRKPLVVLVGRWTASMGEGLASGLDGAGIGTVIGTEMHKLAGATKNYNFLHFNFGYQVPYIEVLHSSGLPREKFVPKHTVNCSNDTEDEFIKEALILIKKL